MSIKENIKQSGLNVRKNCEGVSNKEVLRNYQHDNLRFVLVLLSVFYSILGTSDKWKETSVYGLLFFLCVPCLFFLSGYYAKNNRKKVLLSFLIPYLGIQSILFILEKFVSIIFLEQEILLQFSTPFGNLWYLLVIIFCYLLLPVLEENDTKKQGLILMGTIFLSLLVGRDDTFGEYLAISQTFTFLPFFLAGYYLHTNTKLQEQLNTIFQQEKSKLLVFVGCCLGILFILSPTFVSAEILAGGKSYGLAEYDIKLKFMCYLYSFIWIAFCFFVLPISPKKLPIITNAGKVSYAIYLTQSICTCYLLVTKKTTTTIEVVMYSLIIILLSGNIRIGQSILYLVTLQWLRPAFILVPLRKLLCVVKKLHNHLTKQYNKSLKVYQIICYGISILLVLLGIIFCTVSDFLLNCFDNLSMNKILFHLQAPMHGAGNSMVHEYFSYEKILLHALLFVLFSGICLLAFYKPLRNWKKTAFISVLLSICLLVVNFAKIMYCLDFVSYISAQATDSDFIELNYVNPKNVEIQFPEEKRNLIYIYLESMETTFMSKEDGGAMTNNLIPELTRLAKENINFSETDGIGGANATNGSTWTIGALASQVTGLPLLVQFDWNHYTGYGSFLPGATALGDILQEQGYQQEFLVGSDMSFAGRNELFTYHGNYKLWDYYTAIEEKKIPEDYYVWWGYEDKKLYEYAKEEILELASQPEPFNFTMLTVDTHRMDGYVCDICPNNSEVQYENVLACASRQLNDFINWIKDQDFYDNTTIIVTGDHLTMDQQYISSRYDNSVPRRVYNCFINAIGTDAYSKNRKFSTIDMFPTTLASLGATIKGERLGLGTNLFSGKQTLAEQYGYEKLNEEFLYSSDFYMQELMHISNE